MRTLLLSLFTLLTLAATAQDPFRNLPFDEALRQAQQQGRLILLQYESADCEHCNEVADKGFDNPRLFERLANTFICVRISPTHPDRERIGQLYNISKGFGSLFIDGDKALIHSFLKTTTNSADLEKQVDEALAKAGENMRIKELEAEYTRGNRAWGFLELLLQKRKTLHLPTDALLDEYVTVVPEDSVKSPRVLSFVASMAPVLTTRADTFLRVDQMAFTRAWYSLPTQQRVAINSEIIYKSMNKAIQKKDERFAFRTATFAQSTYVNNYQGGARSFERNMLEFYRQTNDTTKYFTKAIAYYDRYYMSVSADSIRRLDSLTLRRMLASAPVSAVDTISNGKKVVMRKNIQFAPMVQGFARELNNGAYTIYKMTTNSYLLSTATEWAKRALEFYESPEVMDTYARLLYKQHQNDPAITLEERSIELRKKRGFPTKDFETTLAKMKKGAVLTD